MISISRGVILSSLLSPGAGPPPQTPPVTVLSSAERPKQARAERRAVPDVVTAVARAARPAIGNRGVGAPEHPTRGFLPSFYRLSDGEILRISF